MGTNADVAQMKQKLDDATCIAIPCANCAAKVNKVYSIGARPLYYTSSWLTCTFIM